MANPLDMNETETNNTTPNEGISIDTLVKIIGIKSIENFIQDENIKKIQEQAVTIVKQSSSNNAELSIIKNTLAVSNKERDDARAELETIKMERDFLKNKTPEISEEEKKLRVINAADDVRIVQLEKQVHDVAVMRDEIQKENHVLELDKRKLLEQHEADGLEIESLRNENKRLVELVPSKTIRKR